MENLTNWCVYMHENRANGKKYIGLTHQKPTRRWANGEGYKNSDRFYAAIQKYGWDAFRHELLFTDLTQEEAERLEVALIAKYGTQDPERGYNMEPGGRVNMHTDPGTIQKMSEAKRGEKNPWFGQSLSDEHREKIAGSLRGKPGHPQSMASREKLSAALRGNQRRLGVPHSKETREAMSAARRGAGNPRASGVRCVETGREFDTIAAAEAATGVSSSHISRVCRGSRKTAGGLHWEYVEAADAK